MIVCAVLVPLKSMKTSPSFRGLCHFPALLNPYNLNNGRKRQQHRDEGRHGATIRGGLVPGVSLHVSARHGCGTQNSPLEGG